MRSKKGASLHKHLAVGEPIPAYKPQAPISLTLRIFDIIDVVVGNDERRFEVCCVIGCAVTDQAMAGRRKCSSHAMHS